MHPTNEACTTCHYLDEWVKLMHFKASIVLFSMIQQIRHDRHVVLNVLAQWNGDRLTATMRKHIVMTRCQVFTASTRKSQPNRHQ